LIVNKDLFEEAYKKIEFKNGFGFPNESLIEINVSKFLSS